LSDIGALEIPTTTEGYAELERFLDSVKVQSLSRWMEYYRLYAEADFYFFFRYVTSYGRIIHTTYRTPIYAHQIAIDRAKATQYHIEQARGLDSSSRRSGKSEQRTSAGGVWFYIHHPDMASTIVSVEKALALRHLRRVKNELEKNRMYPTLWPELFYDDPQRENKENGVTWSLQEGLCLKGRKDPTRSNQTFEAHTFYGGGPIGSTFDLALADDIERRDKVSSPEAIEELDTAFSEMMTLMTPRVVQKPVVLISNTRFAQGGLIQRISDRYKSADPKLVFSVPAEIIEEEHDHARKYVHTPALGPLGGEVTWPFTREFLVSKWEESPDKSEYILQYGGSYRKGATRRSTKSASTGSISTQQTSRANARPTSASTRREVRSIRPLSRAGY
jgi:hypothetical protein